MKFFLAVFFTLVFLLSQTQSVSASITSGSIKLESAPPASQTAGSCTGSIYCKDIGTCYNSEAPGVTDCGTACKVDGGSFGVAWTKYNFDGCFLGPPDQEGNQVCYSYYPPAISAVYSTADKCSNGQDPPNPSEPYLRAGQCNGTIGGIYKTCCSNTSPSYLSLDSCVPTIPFSNAPYPPYDGVCPAGSHSVQCGFGSNPECGQAACGPVGTPRTCDYNRSYNQCCGNNLSQNVDEYTWSDGTGVCNHIVGECNQTDPACAGATPPLP